MIRYSKHVSGRNMRMHYPHRAACSDSTRTRLLIATLKAGKSCYYFKTYLVGIPSLTTVCVCRVDPRVRNTT